MQNTSAAPNEQDNFHVIDRNIADVASSTTRDGLPDYSFLDTYQSGAFSAVIGAAEQRDRMHVVAAPTGFGKTRLAIAVADYFIALGYIVLWLSTKWPLLEQAVAEFNLLRPSLRRTMRRIGGATETLAGLSEDGSGKLYFTTLPTWHRRQSQQTLPKKVRRRQDLLLLWDEYHWAATAELGTTLRRHYLGSAAGRTHRNPFVVGLSATPKELPNGQAQVAWSMPYHELIGVRLAHPLHRSVQTGVTWDPIIRNHVIAAESLRVLASNCDRNEAIVNEILCGRSKGHYHKILVFACNIEHAVSLNQLLCERGVPSRVVHSRISADSRKQTVRQFQYGEVDVLVNVNQFVDGNNIPEIDTVVIARPAASRGQLIQMIGRGCRLLPGKSHFYVVELTDRILRHADQLYCVSDVMAVKETASIARSDTDHRVVHRHQEPKYPIFENFELSGAGVLTFTRDQTFGVEIELTGSHGVPPEGRAWKKTALEIIKLLHAVVGDRVNPHPLPYHGRTEDLHWTVERDSSAGWEIVSPILVNAPGLNELRQVCNALQQLLENNSDLRVNWRTGLHITLATRLNSTQRVSGFLKRVQRLEPGLFTLVAPSRLYGFTGGKYDLTSRNSFCEPWRESNRNLRTTSINSIVEDHEYRYRSVNIQRAYDDIEKLEVRMHQGTVEFRKIGLWLSLWMQIFNRARYAWHGHGARGDVFCGDDKIITLSEVANEDILKLLEREGIMLHPEMQQQLRDRRRELRKYWVRALPNRVASWDLAGWYDTQR